MKKYFQQLVDHGIKLISDKETLLINYLGESSDFCRFNNRKVRQVGAVNDSSLDLQLINGLTHATFQMTVSHDVQTDFASIEKGLKYLRESISVLPEDPHLLFSKEVNNSEVIDKDLLIPTNTMIEEIIEFSSGLDLVGILAAGGIFRGFANSLGQFNWYEKYNFNFDWSCYLHSDKAVKSAYAGNKWDSNEIKHKLDEVRKHLEILKKEPKIIKPGKYNAYLTPSAVGEITQMMSWGGFSEKEARTKQSPLQKMVDKTASLNSKISVSENRDGGMSPNFNESGFTLPGNVSLIKNGKISGSLISPRTAKEFSLKPNSGQESPSSLSVEAGSIPSEDILKTIGTGLLINNLWYLNFSDRMAGKLTGMTRFAIFWVEDGEIVAPLNVMRFDDSIYNLLGENLIGLTSNKEMMIDPSSYEHRSTDSCNLPGILVKDMHFTL